MVHIDKIISKEVKISVVGLGYVGLPLAVAFSKKANVIGFDSNHTKIEKYTKGIDVTKEVGDQAVKNTKVRFTDDENMLKQARFHVVAVPTPINEDNTPDLSVLENATRTLGRNLSKGSIVVFESTVYPGVTEEICVPLLEEHSNLVCGVDFWVGYSPERIDPGNKVIH